MKIIDFYETVHEHKKGTDLERTSQDKIRKVLGLLEKKQHGTLVDIGCGDGSITELIRRRTKSQVIGIEISKRASEAAKERGFDVVVCNVEAGLPFKDKSFDHVFCGSMIEHLFDVDDLLDEIKRIVKEDGYCILTTPNLAWAPNRFLLLFGRNPIFTEPSYKYNVAAFWAEERGDVAAGHLHLFTLRALVKLLELNQFVVEDIVGSRIIEQHIIDRLGFKKSRAFVALDSLFCLFPSTSAELIIKFRKR